MKTSMKKALAISALACAASLSLPTVAYATHGEDGPAGIEPAVSAVEHSERRQAMATFPVILFNEPGQTEVSEDLASVLSVTVIDLEDGSVAGVAERMSSHKYQLQLNSLKNIGSYKAAINGIPSGFELVPDTIPTVSSGLVSIAQDDTLVYDENNTYHALTRYIVLRETYDLNPKNGVKARLNDPVPDPRSLIVNSPEFPEGTKFEYVSAPKMNMEGRANAVVKATFPNLYTTKTEIYIDVVAESNTPKNDGEGVAYPGQEGNADQSPSKAPGSVASTKALPKTGDRRGIAAFGAVGAACAAGAGAVLSRTARREQERRARYN